MILWLPHCQQQSGFITAAPQIQLPLFCFLVVFSFRRGLQLCTTSHQAAKQVGCQPYCALRPHFQHYFTVAWFQATIFRKIKAASLTFDLQSWKKDAHNLLSVGPNVVTLTVAVLGILNERWRVHGKLGVCGKGHRQGIFVVLEIKGRLTLTVLMSAPTNVSCKWKRTVSNCTLRRFPHSVFNTRCLHFQFFNTLFRFFHISKGNSNPASDLSTIGL